MKSCKFALAALAVLLIGSTATYAVPVTVTYTGDNIVGAFFQNGAAPDTVSLGTHAEDWQNADTAVLDLNAGSSYQLIFLVENDGAFDSGNPAGLLAQISGYAEGEDLLTSDTWQYAVPESAPDSSVAIPLDFDSLTWLDATEYGNNGGDNIWKNVRGSAVPGIDTDAQWIWNENNFADGTHDTLWLRAQITVVPEPASIIVWSLIGLCFAGGIGWRRLKK